MDSICNSIHRKWVKLNKIRRENCRWCGKGHHHQGAIMQMIPNMLVRPSANRNKKKQKPDDDPDQPFSQNYEMSCAFHAKLITYKHTMQSIVFNNTQPQHRWGKKKPKQQETKIMQDLMLPRMTHQHTKELPVCRNQWKAREIQLYTENLIRVTRNPRTKGENPNLQPQHKRSRSPVNQTRPLIEHDLFPLCSV